GREASVEAGMEASVEAGMEASMEAGPPVGPCDATAPIRLYYWNLAPMDSSDDINFLLKLKNQTGTDLPLSSLVARYYFTNELVMPWTTLISYSATCCTQSKPRFDAEVVPSLHSIPPTPTANTYLEIGFTAAAGTLVAGDEVE